MWGRVQARVNTGEGVNMCACVQVTCVQMRVCTCEGVYRRGYVQMRVCTGESVCR